MSLSDYGPVAVLCRAYPRKLRVLVLDDDMERVVAFRAHLPDVDFTHVTCAWSCIRSLKERLWDVVFLDHDLGWTFHIEGIDPGEGTDVVEHLVERAAADPARWEETLFVVHSMNESKNAWMVDQLHFAGLQATLRAQAWTDWQDLHALQNAWTWPMHLERWSATSPPLPVTKRRTILRKSVSVPLPTRGELTPLLPVLNAERA